MSKKYILLFIIFMVVFASLSDFMFEMAIPFDSIDDGTQLAFNSIAGAVGGIVCTFCLYLFLEKKRRRRR